MLQTTQNDNHGFFTSVSRLYVVQALVEEKIPIWFGGKYTRQKNYIIFAYECQFLSNIDDTYFNLLGPHTKGLQMELSFKDPNTTSPAKGRIEQ